MLTGTSKLAATLRTEHGVTLPQARAIAALILGANYSTQALIDGMDIAELSKVTERVKMFETELEIRREKQAQELLFRQQICDLRAQLKKEKIPVEEFIAYLSK
jgi:hypothetical protein